jgi:hypothetical protein
VKFAAIIAFSLVYNAVEVYRQLVIVTKEVLAKKLEEHFVI